jgi:hypothetical protein
MHLNTGTPVQGNSDKEIAGPNVLTVIDTLRKRQIQDEDNSTSRITIYER